MSWQIRDRESTRRRANQRFQPRITRLKARKAPCYPCHSWLKIVIRVQSSHCEKKRFSRERTQSGLALTKGARTALSARRHCSNRSTRTKLSAPLISRCARIFGREEQASDGSEACLPLFLFPWRFTGKISMCSVQFCRLTWKK